MKTLKATDPKTDRVNGTSLTGYLQPTTYDQLFKVLGEPTYYTYPAKDKVIIEWVVEYKGEVFTVYDWKLYYDLSESSDSYQWHIGGKGGYFEDNPTTDDFIHQLEAKLAVKKLLK